MSIYESSVATNFTLFVGEGDFSFAACYLQKALKSPNEHILATCLNSSSLSLNQQENIKFIQCNGGSVLMDVDATKLEIHSVVSKLLFNKIIFNFPHIAKKMNIRENRKLVRDFLQSAKNVLKEDGKIYVTLCRGQGGTDAEINVREWGNSWQIVSLATYSNLILCDIQFFNASYFDSYECTGFRGLLKSFDIDGAITHIFCHVEPILYADINTENIQYERSLMSFIADTQKIYATSSDWLDRPDTRIVACLLNAVVNSKTSLTDCIFIYDLLLCQIASTSICHEKYFCYTNDAFSKKHLNYCSQCLSSLLSISLENMQNEKVVTSICCICCLTNFDISKMPFCHIVSYLSLSQQNLMEVLFTVFNVLKDPHECKETVSSWFNMKNNMKTIQNVGDIFHGAPLSKNWDVKECLPIHVVYSKIKSNGYNFYSGIEIFIIDDTKENNHNSKEYFEIGHILKLNYNMTFYAAAILNLDLISQLKFHIMDNRILFNNEGFYSLQICQDSTTSVFRSPSLFPPSYIHDMSFWITEDFREINFFILIKNTLGIFIKSVVLIDDYKDMVTKRQSRCYRFVYQSSNKALSKANASVMHTTIMRKVIQNSLNVQLR